MTRVLPHDRFELRVPAPPAEVARRIAAQTERPAWRFPTGTKPFTGRVDEHRFRLWRAIRHTNSFLPIVYGTLRGDGAGTVVSVRMRVHPLVPAFLSVWLTGGLVQVSQRSRLVPELVFFLVTFVVAVLLVSYGFWSEAPRTKAALVELLTRPRPGP